MAIGAFSKILLKLYLPGHYSMSPPELYQLLHIQMIFMFTNQPAVHTAKQTEIRQTMDAEYLDENVLNNFFVYFTFFKMYLMNLSH